jgi:hypothetical protein
MMMNRKTPAAGALGGFGMGLKRNPKVTELTDDVLRTRLRELEEKYQMSSEVFLVRFNSGHLGDNREFIRWAGLLDVASEAGIFRPSPAQPTPA